MYGCAVPYNLQDYAFPHGRGSKLINSTTERVAVAKFTQDGACSNGKTTTARITFQKAPFVLVEFCPLSLFFLELIGSKNSITAAVGRCDVLGVVR